MLAVSLSPDQRPEGQRDHHEQWKVDDEGAQSGQHPLRHQAGLHHGLALQEEEEGPGGGGDGGAGQEEEYRQEVDIKEKLS